MIHKAICQSCDYESEPLASGGYNHITIICHHCNSVVNPELIPFKFTKPPCPNCGHLLPRSGLDEPFGLEPSPNADLIKPKYKCPRCKEYSLVHQEIVHIDWILEEEIPREGELVHGMISASGKLNIPGILIIRDFRIDRDSLCLENASDYERQKPMALKVEKIEIDSTNQIDCIKLEFIRYLVEDDFIHPPSPDWRVLDGCIQALRFCLSWIQPVLMRIGLTRRVILWLYEGTRR